MFHSSCSKRRLDGFSVSVILWVLVWSLVCSTSLARAQEDTGRVGNQLLSIAVEKSGDLPSVLIKTREPVGYRYTVYDSFDPVRVVIDFPGMDVTPVPATTKVDASPLQEVRVSSFDLTSGRLGRVELLLTSAANYSVSLSDGEFRVTFASSASAATPAAADATPTAAAATPPATEAVEIPAPRAEGAVAKSEASSEPTASEPPVAVAAESEPQKPAKIVKSVDVHPGSVALNTDGRVDQYQYFVLSAPPRLVVDISGVKPSFKEKTFKTAQGFRQLRVGNYPDKTRFVFDAEGKALPKHAVAKKGSSVIVTWGDGATPAVQLPASVAKKSTPVAAKSAIRAKGAPVSVEAVDFQVENDRSVLSVALSGPAQFTEAKADGNIVRFGVRNATISRALRRTVDASAFPSAVRLITPYTAKTDGGQDVRFAVELKGPAAYSLQKDGNYLRLIVDNGSFAEPKPAAVTKVETSVTAPVSSAKSAAMAAGEEVPVVITAPSGTETKLPKYTGQKISLVFDDADIRKILQLIAEVSELNIIAGDEVKGTISLRLIDVPWDQALDLVMEIKGLGMLREGNVVRILPKDQIRAAEEATLTASRNKEKLEDLVTDVVAVSYTNLANISGPAKGMLTERGKITEDARNKKLIVRDIPSVVADIKNLVSLIDTPERQVMIEARIVEADSSFSLDLGVKWGISYDRYAGQGINGGEANVGLGGSFLIAPPAAGSVGAAGLATGITFGRVGIDSTTLDLRISALEASGHGKIVSTPRVTTLNGGSATISQGTKIPYQSSGADGLPKTEFVDANLELTVKPEINPDNSIILDINATNSSPGSTVSTGAGSAPAIDTKEAKTKVLVRDGETTVIGGIFVDNEDFSEVGVPLLMHIPYLGHLFKSTRQTNTRSELLIFITPRIVN